MKNAWGEYVVWGDNDWLNKINSATIVKTACYPSGTVYDHLEIFFCPFCGAEIEIENIKTIEA